MNIWRLVTSLALFAGFYGNAFAFDKPVVSGSIQRGSSVSSFIITVKVGQVEKFTPQSGETDLFKNRVTVKLNGKSDAVPFKGDPPVPAMPFSLSQSAELQITSNSSNPNLRDFTYSILVEANSRSDFKTFIDENGGKAVKVVVEFKEPGKDKLASDSTEISISSAVVSSAPESLTASGTHKEIKLNWNSSANVTWTGTTPSKKPSGINIVAVEKNSTIKDLPAYIFDEADSDNNGDSAAPDGTCTIDPDFTNGSACVTCSDAKAYLNTEELSKLTSSGVFVVESAADSGEASITGLENDKQYAIFAYYSPGGLSRTACQTASPLANTTYSELNGEDEASLLDTKCFIATAAYGSPLHKNLRALRWFRDQVLLKFSLGRDFVDWYYENGPKAAVYVTASPVLQVLVRGLLWIPVLALSAWMWLANTTHLAPNTMLLASAVFALGLFTLGLLRRHRWTR